MNLPQYFQFSQSNLQDFYDCRRRFYLRHIRRLAWPGVESEPLLENEQFMQQGAAFHRMVQQYYLGIDQQTLDSLALDEPLKTWWRYFIEQHRRLPGLDVPEARFFPELSITASISGFRWIAKYDLVVLVPDHQIYIYDWKTSRSRPRRAWLARRAQTQLYRYLFSLAGNHQLRAALQPESITMLYWYAAFPEPPEIFPYSSNEFTQDRNNFQQLVELIANLVTQDTLEAPGVGFPMTTNENRCAFCTYRSLCDRGIRAGTITESDDVDGSENSLELLDFSLEQIAEIEY